MWTDNETGIDFLNFTGVASAAAEVIHQANDSPITLGISGNWGVGKSSMIKLLRAKLEKITPANEGKYVFVHFNAWLYQGYDDARAALVEAVATELQKEAGTISKAQDKIKEVISRIDIFRIAQVAIPSALALAFGIPPVGLLGSVGNILASVSNKTVDAKTVEEADKLLQSLNSDKSFLKTNKDSSPQKEIQIIRDSFTDALQELNVTLVVLIDDLDRCLPATTIATLEAIRLLLFLPRTAFVIAADETMIKHAVKQHFEGVDEKLVGSYYDKIVQVPIRVPPLGTQEVRAYLMLLFVENSNLDKTTKDEILNRVSEQLKQGWQGRRVDRNFMESLSVKLPPELIERFNLADRLAPMMTTNEGIRGNPRLIKRFLNAMQIRMSLARAQSITVDESVLIKLMLFERSAPESLYQELCSDVAHDEEGKPRFLGEPEELIAGDNDNALKDQWSTPFLKEWLSLPPRLADVDLRGALYVSRDRAPLMFPEDKLSSDGAEVLELLIKQPSEAEIVKDKLLRLQPQEISLILSRLFEKAGREQMWGVPDILTALITVVRAAPSQGAKLSEFFSTRPSIQIKPDIVPTIAGEPWANTVLQRWNQSSEISPTVKKAIKNTITN